ncbi:MAG: methyl-accepting chemotaxis protein [Deltaproteobacteria bacterium]|nr:methyl-accepting chemotaxis protein [Deltaproteobacteria bacterium]
MAIVNRRRSVNFSIKREMQLRLLLRVMLIVVVAIGLSGVFFYFYSRQSVGHSFKQFHIQATTFLDFLLPVVIIALVTGVVTALILTVFFPHKIAGPLYRMERLIKDEVGNGNLTVKFTVRNGDELQDLADALNIMQDRLKDKVGMINEAAQALQHKAHEMAKKDPSAAEVAELAQRLKEALKGFRL